MKLAGRCIVQKCRPSSKVGVALGCTSRQKSVAFGYDVGKISAGCIVFGNICFMGTRDISTIAELLV